MPNMNKFSTFSVCSISITIITMTGGPPVEGYITQTNSAISDKGKRKGIIDFSFSDSISMLFPSVEILLPAIKKTQLHYHSVLCYVRV